MAFIVLQLKVITWLARKFRLAHQAILPIKFWVLHFIQLPSSKSETLSLLFLFNSYFLYYQYFFIYFFSILTIFLLEIKLWTTAYYFIDKFLYMSRCYSDMAQKLCLFYFSHGHLQNNIFSPWSILDRFSLPSPQILVQ